MAWLFERTVEVAAWVALFVAWCSFALALKWFYLFVATLSTQPDYAILCDSAKGFGAFVGFALALGALACVDRFLFDADELPNE